MNGIRKFFLRLLGINKELEDERIKSLIKEETLSLFIKLLDDDLEYYSMARSLFIKRQKRLMDEIYKLNLGKQVNDEVTRCISLHYINSEAFIDKIVERILSKQLNKG